MIYANGLLSFHEYAFTERGSLLSIHYTIQFSGHSDNEYSLYAGF